MIAVCVCVCLHLSVYAHSVYIYIMYCIYIRRSGAESSAKRLALLFEMLEWNGYSQSF